MTKIEEQLQKRELEHEEKEKEEEKEEHTLSAGKDADETETKLTEIKTKKETEMERKKETETEKETESKTETETGAASCGNIFTTINVDGDGADLEAGNGEERRRDAENGRHGKTEVEGRHSYSKLREESPPPTYSSMPPEFEEALKNDKVRI